MGTWKWDRVLEQMATSMNDGNGSTALTDLTHEKVDHVFDQIDSLANCYGKAVLSVIPVPTLVRIWSLH